MQALKRASTANTDLPIKLLLASAVRPKGAVRLDMWQERAKSGIPKKAK